MAVESMSVGLGAGCGDMGDGVEVGLSVVVDGTGVGEAVGSIVAGARVGLGVGGGVAGMAVGTLVGPGREAVGAASGAGRSVGVDASMGTAVGGGAAEAGCSGGRAGCPCAQAASSPPKSRNTVSPDQKIQRGGDSTVEPIVIEVDSFPCSCSILVSDID